MMKKKKKTRVRLDVKLVDLSANRVRIALAKEGAKRVDDVLWRTGPHPPTQFERKELLQFGVAQTGKLLRRLYAICGRVWRIRRPILTPHFFKVVFEKVIKPGVEDGLIYTNELLRVVLARSQFTLQLPLVTAGEWAPHGKLLEEEWKDKVGIASRRLRLFQSRIAIRRPGNPGRALFVESVIKEIQDLKREGLVESDYEKAREAHKDFHSFEIAEDHKDIKDRLKRLSGERGKKGFAKDIAAAYYGKSRSQIDVDYKYHNPEKIRRTTQ